MYFSHYYTIDFTRTYNTNRCRYLLNVNHELRDTIMHASMINPRPQMYFPVSTLLDTTRGDGAVGAASATGDFYYVFLS